MRALIITCLCLYAVAVVAQERPAAPVPTGTPSEGVTGVTPFVAPILGAKADGWPAVRPSISVGWDPAAIPPGAPGFTPGAGPVRITLEEAQQQAAVAGNPMLLLAELGVEVARQHRLGVQSDFFPKISSTFANLHFNKFMGETVVIHRPFLGNATLAVPLLFKDMTVAAATVTQPITPLFKLRQVLAIARADERVAMAKAGMPAAGVASNVEQSYLELLVAQRQRTIAEASVNRLENKRPPVSSASATSDMEGNDAEWIEANRSLIISKSKVQEATAALNTLLGWPLTTELELAIPASFYENISAADAVEEALRNNPEIVEAEQTLVKARAASKLSKLDYIPDVAVVGGYAYQNATPILPNDFAFVGVMVSYNLFDSGKRERTMLERNAQVAMAEIALQLTKAKVAAGVSKAYFVLDRARQLSDLARRANSASQLNAGYDSEQALAARARSEADMLQTELEYRSAFSRLQQLIGTRSPTSNK